MALSIRNAELEALARELASKRGTGMTDVILDALRSARESGFDEARSRLTRIRDLTARCASLPVLDARSPDEILGYGESGTFS